MQFERAGWCAPLFPVEPIESAPRLSGRAVVRFTRWGLAWRLTRIVLPLAASAGEVFKFRERAWTLYYHFPLAG